MKIFNYIFTVDGGLKVSSRAPSLVQAERNILQMWPSSSIKLVSEEFSHDSNDYAPNYKLERAELPKPKLGRNSTVSPMASAKKAAPEKEMTEIERIEKSLVSAYMGA